MLMALAVVLAIDSALAPQTAAGASN